MTGRRAFIRRLVGAVVASGLLGYEFTREETITYHVRFLDPAGAGSYIEARRVQVMEVARTFNIPPEMLVGLAEDMVQYPNPPMETTLRQLAGLMLTNT